MGTALNTPVGDEKPRGRRGTSWSREDIGGARGTRDSAGPRRSARGNRTGDVDAVSRLHLVDEVVVGVDDRRVRRLTGRHVVGGLLNFNL